VFSVLQGSAEALIERGGKI